MSSARVLVKGAVSGRKETKFLRGKRKGAVLVLAAFFMVAVMALLAFCVDTGYILTLNSELKRSTDAAALAGAGNLINGPELAELGAFEYVLRNPIENELLAQQEGWEGNLASLLSQAKSNGAFSVAVGQWDPEGSQYPMDESDPDDPIDGRFKTYDPSVDPPPSAIRVRTEVPDCPLFFGQLFRQHRTVYDENGVHTEPVPIELAAVSIARYQPRDIMLVLDFSGSMSDDSELCRISQFGESVRERVESNLRQIWEDLGSPTYGNMQFAPVYISSTDNYYIKQQLGLSYVSYPYPSGSWDDYINYVKGYYNTPKQAGYYKKYGYLTLVNYWLEKRPGASQTPDLWKACVQPIGAVKDSSNIFMEYIQEVNTEDRVGLVIYNSSNQTAITEHSLTDDFDTVQNTIQHRQAAHYDSYTNIGAGIQYAREELEANARAGSFKMIVLMTDGEANRPSTDPDGFVRQQASLVADHRWPIVTISLGDKADTNLMQQVADTTGGIHFNIPGGGTVTDYRDGLLEVFRTIADDRPLVLVK